MSRTGQGFLWWELRTPNHGWRPISLDGIAKLPKLFEREVNVALDGIADLLLAEIKFGFHKMIREGRGFRARNSSYPGASPITLMRRMIPALTRKLFNDGEAMGVLIFDLARMDRATQNEGRKTGSRGWFMKFVDGHEGRRHGSQEWGFLSLQHAKRLAEQCIVQQNLGKEAAAELRQLVATKFKGKHNEGDEEDGIMVNLKKSLFFRWPEFGKASKYVRPHPGYYGWPVFDDVTRTLRGEKVKDALTSAIERAFQRLE